MALESADTVGEGIDATADTTEGVAVASVPPALATVTVKPRRAVALIAPDAVQSAFDVAAFDASAR